MPPTTCENVRDMKRRAYWGVSAAMSMGTETKDTSLKQRSQDFMPRRAAPERRAWHHRRREGTRAGAYLGRQ